ncbi:MAG: TetR/AcrR family transcriptional regulator [Nitrospinae bacterium]|nr:TetR/AcrR family transcriptional regulator [Nitrospinota bacterium]
MKNRIIDTAEKRFSQYGFRRVTMDDIASDLGISKKTLYQNFKSKDDIAWAVKERMHKDIDRLLKKAKKEIPEPIERFKRVIAEVTERVAVIGSAFMTDIKKDIPDLWRECEEFREREIYKYIGGILEEGIKKGKIRKDIDTKIAVMAYLGAIRMIIQPEILMENKFSIADAFDSILKIFLEGIQM